MSYYLFLDDERFPKDVKWINLPLARWFIARNYDQFVRIIKSDGLPIHISFDHDLAFDHYPTKPQTGTEVIDYDKLTEKTGYHCAKWLVEFCLDTEQKLPNFSVHSKNIVGKVNITNLLENFKKFQNEPV